MPCPNCGADVRPGARFCNRCGAPAGGWAADPGDTVPLLGQRAPRRDAGAEAETMPPLMARAPTDPGSGAPAGGGQSGGGVSGEPAPAAASPADDAGDGLPWPLPAGMIVDGRYRIEALVSGGDAENVYAVTDLRGYERCWACGTEYGPGAAGERFCRECGADMLARELLLRERAAEGGAEEDAAAPAGASGDARDFAQGARAYRVEPKVAPHPAFPLGVRLVAGCASDIGRYRGGDANEDSALVLVLDRVHEDRTLAFGLFAVADGMGGHANGQRASRLVLNVLAHTVLRQVALPMVGRPVETPVDEEQYPRVLREAVRAANNALCAANKEAGLDAGSTLVAALICGETAYVANVGDSRCYVLDDQGLRRITSDHSLVEQLVAGGLIERDEVYTHPQRNQIFRSLGDDPELAIDLFTQKLQPGMRLLLCCDGVWEMVRDPRIEEVLRAQPDAQSACDALVAAANEGGGEDNITAVVVGAR